MISICIPVFNDSKYIRKCIESIIAQTYTDWECIICDDKSTDNTLECIPEDPRIRIYKNEKNLGCGLNRRKCIELAKGDWFVFIDGDDYVKKDYLETLIKNSKGVDIVWTGAPCSGIKTGLEMYKYATENWIYFTCWGKLWSRKVVSSKIYSKLKLCEDVATNCYWMTSAQKVKCIQEEFYTYTRYGDNNSIAPNMFNVLNHIYALYENMLCSIKNNMKDKAIIFNNAILNQYWPLIQKHMNTQLDKTLGKVIISCIEFKSLILDQYENKI